MFVENIKLPPLTRTSTWYFIEYALSGFAKFGEVLFIYLSSREQFHPSSEPIDRKRSSLQSSLSLLSMASSPKVKTPPATPQAINKFFEEQMQSSVPTQHRMAHMINGTLDSANIAPMGGASPRSPSYWIRPATDSALETRSDCVAF